MDFNYDIDQIKLDEGFRDKPYKCTADKTTIGYGWNIEDGITKQDAELVLINQLTRVDLELAQALDFYPSLPAEVQNILCNLTFNLGLTRLLKFQKMLAAMSVKDWQEAANEMLDSKYARQVPLRANRLADRLRVV